MKPKNHIFSQSTTTKCRWDPSFFVLLVSLSHFSFVSTCALSRGGGGRVTRPHSLLRVGGGFIYQGRPLQVGGVDPRVIYFFRVRSAEVHGIGWRQASNDACWRRHRACRCFWVADTVSGPYPFGFFRTMERLQGFGRTSGDLPTSADTCLRGHATSPNSGCLLRQTAGALIVTLLVTIQGSASCA